MTLVAKLACSLIYSKTRDTNFLNNPRYRRGRRSLFVSEDSTQPKEVPILYFEYRWRWAIPPVWFCLRRRRHFSLGPRFPEHALCSKQCHSTLLPVSPIRGLRRKLHVLTGNDFRPNVGNWTAEKFLMLRVLPIPPSSQVTLTDVRKGKFQVWSFGFMLLPWLAVSEVQ